MTSGGSVGFSGGMITIGGVGNGSLPPPQISSGGPSGFVGGTTTIGGVGNGSLAPPQIPSGGTDALIGVMTATKDFLSIVFIFLVCVD
jgi:hypothetical protein